MPAFQELRNVETIDELRQFIRDNYETLLTDFYGEDVEHLALDNAFIHLRGKPWLRPPLSATAQALLMWFTSVFQAHDHWGRLNDISDLFREVAWLHALLRSMFLYRHITGRDDYSRCFNEIHSLLLSIYGRPETDAQTRRLCEDMFVEYLTRAIVRTGRQDILSNAEAINDSCLLDSARIRAIWHCQDYEHEYVDARARVAECFFDEANRILQTELDIGGTVVEQTVDECENRNCHCPFGMHHAKEALKAQYPAAYAQTQAFVKQSFNAVSYTPFDTEVECMRYLRQYMPLHMPQIEEAIICSLQCHKFHGQHVRILDIGAGPGTLYCVLASMLGRDIDVLDGYTFEYCQLEPSARFLEFFQVIAGHVYHDRLKAGQNYNKTLEEMADEDMWGIDWIFLGNAITPILGAAINYEEKARKIRNALCRSQARKPLLTIAENSASIAFNDFCNALDQAELNTVCTIQRRCDGNWLHLCNFFVTTLQNHWANLQLKTFTRQ